MSSNLDRIVNVTIDLQTVVSSGASFDTILLVGPPPLAPTGEGPADFSAYTSLAGVNAVGYVSEGEGADPVGIAARVAFSQTTKPARIYIAPQRLSVAAVESGKIIEAVKGILDTFTSEEASEDYKAAYDEKRRVMLVDLAKDPSTIEDKPTADPIAAIVNAGYTLEIGGQEVATLAAFKLGETYTSNISSLTEGSPSVQFAAHVKGKSGADVPFGIIVSYSTGGPNVDVIPPFTGEPLANPQDELEKPAVTLSRAEAASNGWYVALAAGIAEDDLEGMAEWTEAREKMFGYSYADPDDNPVSEIYYRTFGLCYGAKDVEADLYKHVAMAVRFLSYSSGSETWVNKSLASVSISTFTEAQMTTLEAEGANTSYYIKCGDTGLVQGGKVRSGEWIDVIRFRDWLKNDMQLRIINLLVKRPKVPYTDKGIGMVRNQMIASLSAGVRAGGIAEDQYDEEDNLIPGFTTSVPLAASLTDEQKKSRKLNDCRFTAMLAGAIHAVQVNGSLAYSY